MQHRLSIGSVWEVEQLRRKSRGALYDWVTISKDKSPNVVTNEGFNSLLDVYLGAVSAHTWYVALFEDDYTPLITNTYDVPGYAESDGYDETDRQVYTIAAASSKSCTNAASKATFTMKETVTIYGGSLVSVITRGDHTAGANTNILFCSSKFLTAKECVDNDILTVTIVVTGADA